MEKNKRHSGRSMYGEPLPYKIWRSLLIVTGPVVYLFLSLLPWLGKPEFSFTLPQLKLPAFSRVESSQVGSLTLRVDKRDIELHGTTGFTSTILEYGKLNLHWTEMRPLVLIMPDGQQQQLLPSSYRALADGFALEFSKHLELLFRTGSSGLNADLSWPDNLQRPSEIRLPWDGKQKDSIRQSGEQIQILADGSNSGAYLSSMAPLAISPENYLVIPIQYFAFLDVALNKSEADAAAQQQSLHQLPILWEQMQPRSGDSPTQNLYQQLYRTYYNRMFGKMKMQAERGEIPSPEWIALYLQLVLQQDEHLQDSPGNLENATIEWPNYEEVRQQMQQFVSDKSWDAPELAPYLGIGQNSLKQFIRDDYSRIERVRNSYFFANWSFAGQKDLAPLLFNYGFLQLLLNVTRVAVQAQQSSNLSMEESFYLLNFLWQISNVYPRNGIVNREETQQQFRDWLLQQTTFWQQNGFPEGLSVSFVLDVVQTLWNTRLQLQEQGYSVALQLFQLMDGQGNLPQVYHRENVDRELAAKEQIPYFHSWRYLTATPLFPQNTTVVPGFWVWTTGGTSVFYKSGQPIQMTVDNFPSAQGNKLVLLRGIYFYPLEVRVDDEPIDPVGQIPRPQFGKPASWYYDPDNKYLAVEIPASTQETTQLTIR